MHGLDFSLDEMRIHAEAMQAPGHQVWEVVGQNAEVPGWFQYRQEREGTDEEKKRLAVDDDSIGIPIPQTRARRPPGIRFLRQMV